MKNPSGGVLGFITNHGYLDNPTFRGMRWHLLRSFDHIRVVDLHGSSKKSECAPDGSVDNNVFDILPGVAIVIAVKRPRISSDLAELRSGDLWGTRALKYETLWNASPEELTELIEPRPPAFSFKERDHALDESYQRGFSLKELMPTNCSGTLSARDRLTVDVDRAALWARMNDLASRDTEAVREQYSIGADSKSWSLQGAQEDVRNSFSETKLAKILYRPFDKRWTYYTGSQSGIYFFPADVVMRHVVGHPNVGLAFTRKVEGTRKFADVLVFDDVFTLHSLSLKEVNYIAPLYLYPDNAADQADAFAGQRRANFDPQILRQLLKAAGIKTPVSINTDANDALRATGEARPTEVKVFDYIYGVLHSPAYRERYAELLKAEFPRIPLPASPDVFGHVSEKGEELRRTHLMEPAAGGDAIYHYFGSGDDVVAMGYPKWENDRVHINMDQYFQGVPNLAWEFAIGDYRPAQKWLKDRRGRSLSFDDITHYQRIIKILAETDRLMKEIEFPLE